MAIRILPDDLVNRIAAGEVVERPASVVKELVENALDAGATEITIDVADGGRTLIQVSDNGCGMTREDLEKSVLRHATSKLPTDDLLNISYMGFRGEALPSIASVSEMTIESNGLALARGEIKPSAWSGGTRVRVENLFQNVPARLKFLRSDRVELMAVMEVVRHLALARTDVGFTFGKMTFKPSDPLISRIREIVGADADGKMIEVAASDGDVRLTGFVSAPTLRRASSVDQYLFVNHRFVKDKLLVGSLRAAYFDVMKSREYPICCLYVEIPKEQVDVNVSPAKTDVHFLEPARIRNFIVGTIRRALAPMSAPGVRRDIGDAPVSRPWSMLQEFDLQSPAPQMPPQVLDMAAADSGGAISFPLGFARAQIGNKYVIAENSGGILIIDQHAAHERIVYEKLRKNEIKRQPLLIPIIVKLSPDQVSAVMEIKGELEESGLIIGEFGDSEIAVYETPADFELDWGACLADFANEARSYGHSSAVKERLHLKLANYACHHSVRAGQKLSLEQMNALLREIEATERGGQCNHGRPVWKTFSNDELDGMFERS